MFDPDNFYEILRCSYSWPRTTNVPLRFVSHGSKKLEDLAPLLADEEKYRWEHELNWGDCTAYAKMILHDQEPFSFVDSSFTYKEFRKANKKSARLDETLDFLDYAGVLNTHFKSGIQPIFCHSELNSSDIKSMIDGCMAIECYYWYHGMIARDWFRHWQHHPHLSIADKSQSQYRFLIYSRAIDGSRAYRKQFIDSLLPIKDIILYDWEKKIKIGSDYSAKIEVNDANSSAIHIVLETLFDTQKIHLTEKVFKPMVMNQPFFLLSGPGSLQYLRDYGFQTFGKFWDESYDLVVDSEERMWRIRKEIDKIAAMELKDFRNLYKSLLPIIEHNRRHFFSPKFQDICIKEMSQNFATALKIQQDNLEIYPGGPWAKVLSELVDNDVFIPDDWLGIARQFLKSQHLTVPVEKIFKIYPSLMKLLD